MAEADPLRKYVEAGIAFTQLTKAKAESIVRELVRAGDVQREQAQDRVEELLDRSRKSTDGLVGVVRREIAQQLSSLGFATKADIEGLEARMEERLAAVAPKPAGPAPTPAKAAKAAKVPKAATPAGSGAARPRPAKAAAAPPPGSAARKAAAPGSRRRPAAPGEKA